MEITCAPCAGTGTIGGGSCPTCDGDGLVDLTDAKFKTIYTADLIATAGIVWDSILTSLEDLTDKCNDIKEKCDEIKAVVDGL